MLEHITASEVAGYGVGALLVCATISATKIDGLISASQRSSLGMCKRCGDLRVIACSTCKGVGLIKEGGPFNLIPLGDTDNLFGGKLKLWGSDNACARCRATGRFSCPDCSQLGAS